jgi:TolB-like protein/class 3 adenylate cyclase/Tfp pilus assembly protein PilF
MSHARLFDRAVGDRTSAARDAAEVGTTRHLAAILSADVAGYSRLMGADEERTYERLKAHRRQLVDPKIKAHHGRIVKTTGDGMLVEFPSVVDAVRCAVEMQRAMVDRDADIAEDKRITFRIGVNLGDVIAEAGDIYGDGVNVAARLEALAEPGGICISGTVWDHIRDKLPYSFEDMGEQSVKNIARPVRVYAMDADAVASLPLVAALTETSFGRSRSPKPFLIGASAAAAVGLGIAVWWVWPHASSPTAPIQVSAAVGPQSSPAQVAVPAANLKTAAAPRLSIVVLPFSNLSNDPDQEYFVDAITDDLTTDLSRISDSFVIARNTAFTYKGKAVDVKQVSRDLGVRYVLEGSVRRMGDRAQVNVQLIDGETGAHLWADRFETDRRNLADAQTEITGRLARTLHLELVQDAGRRIERERAADPESRDLVMRGWALWYRPFSVANREEAQQLFERALEIDRGSVDARIGIAVILIGRLNSGSAFSSSPERDRAEQLLREALGLDANRSMAHAAMGFLRRVEDRQADAQAELETAIALDRNNAWAITQLGLSYMLGGQPEPCIPTVEKALRISPREGDAYTRLGKCHLFLGHVGEALNLFRKGEAATPSVWYVHLKLAGTLGLIGNLDEARAQAAEMVRLNPKMNSVARIRGLNWYRNARFQTFHDTTIIQGLRNIEFPEEVAAQ